MSQVITKRNRTPGSLSRHEAARTVLLRMAFDQSRAERIHQLKQEHPELTWAQIAEKVGVTERSALDWQKTGGISHDNCKKLAKVFGVDPSWLWSGDERPAGTPDLLGALHGNGDQLAVLNDKLDRILEILEPLAAEQELGGAVAAIGEALAGAAGSADESDQAASRKRDAQPGASPRRQSRAQGKRRTA